MKTNTKFLSVQFIKYACIGLSTNGVAYALYLFVTWAGIGHKTAMTAIFAIVTTLGYLGNRKITFSHQGQVSISYAKYWATYVGCYFFNLGVMYVAVDLFKFMHQLVQLALIFFDAPVLFLLQKFWVFRAPPVVGEQCKT